MNPDVYRDHGVRILYFGRLSEQLDCREERLAPPEAVETTGQLQAWLIERGGQWIALSDARIRVAVNQEIAGLDAAINYGDEIAFFPPVTGG